MILKKYPQIIKNEKKIIKFVYIFFVFYLLYVIFLYATGNKETFLMPEGYEGPLLIIANQQDGVEINADDAIYDFTKSNVLKIKNDLVTGFSPWGYLNFFAIDSKGSKRRIKLLNKDKEHANINTKEIYVWDYYFQLGDYGIKAHENINYEAMIISKASSVDSVIHLRNILLNEQAFKAKLRQ